MKYYSRSEDLIEKRRLTEKRCCDCCWQEQAAERQLQTAQQTSLRTVHDKMMHSNNRLVRIPYTVDSRFSTPSLGPTSRAAVMLATAPGISQT